jgi:hypothetical protein
MMKLFIFFHVKENEPKENARVTGLSCASPTRTAHAETRPPAAGSHNPRAFSVRIADARPRDKGTNGTILFADHCQNPTPLQKKPIRFTFYPYSILRPPLLLNWYWRKSALSAPAITIANKKIPKFNVTSNDLV